MKQPDEGHGHGVVGEGSDKDGKAVASLLLLGCVGLTLVFVGFMAPRDIGGLAKAGFMSAGFITVGISKFMIDRRL